MNVAAAPSSFVTVPLIEEAKKWYASFDVGNSQQLSLGIKLGVSDLAVAPGFYTASANATNLNSTGGYSYINKQHNKCFDDGWDYTLYTDGVSVQGLVVHDQIVENVTKAPSTYDASTTIDRGYVGFSNAPAGQASDSASESSFFQSLCDQGQLEECRFGVALGTGGTGNMFLGGFDRRQLDLYPPYSSASLSFEALDQGVQWSILGSVRLSTGNLRNQKFVLDTSIVSILGPRNHVRQLFEHYNITPYEQQPSGCGPVLHGYYNCSAPPSVGFELSTNSPQMMLMHPLALDGHNDGHDNCTAAVVGVDFNATDTDSTWILGQAFFQGKYLDFDVTRSRVGFADISSLAALKGET